MLHVACCGQIELADTDDTVRSLMERCASEAGFGGSVVSEYASPLDLIDAVTGSRATGDTDVAIAGLGLSGISGIGLARELRDEGFTQHLVLCAESHDDALEALRLHVDGYLVPPISTKVLMPILERMLRRIWAYHAESLVIRAREGARRVRMPQLLFSETADHDQRIHLADGTCLSMRMSSRALFELLSDSGRFFKAGSSYIVNMRAVRNIDPRASTATMTDGTVIPIPVRLRKALENAILANR